MKRILSCVVLGTLVATASAEMTARTSWSQRWPWNAKVDIDFTLEGGAKCDVAVSASFKTNGVPASLDLEQAGLEGDIWELAPGYHHLVWNPEKSGIDVKTLTDFSVTVSPVENAVERRAWLVFDVASGSYSYLSASDAPATWDDNIYRQQKIVFRRIPAGTFTLGYTAEQTARLRELSPGNTTVILTAREVTLTSDYYISIYQITGGQINRLDPSASYATQMTGWTGDRLKIGAGAHCFLRGSNAVEGVSWPTTKFHVTTNSWMGRFRARSGNRLMFDLPTSAQWQKAARPDARWFWYDTPEYGGGTVADTPETLTNVVGTICQAVTLMATPNAAVYNPPPVAGKYQPNAWGLCDLIASRSESILDQWVNSATAALETLDPVGPTSNPQYRMLHNSFTAGKMFAVWAIPAVSRRETDHDTNTDTLDCFRMVIHLRPPQSFAGRWK